MRIHSAHPLFPFLAFNARAESRQMMKPSGRQIAAIVPSSPVNSRSIALVYWIGIIEPEHTSETTPNTKTSVPITRQSSNFPLLMVPFRANVTVLAVPRGEGSVSTCSLGWTTFASGEPREEWR